jgi:hypothetical protein
MCEREASVAILSCEVVSLHDSPQLSTCDSDMIYVCVGPSRVSAMLGDSIPTSAS